jgi:hypothetical protein
MKNIKKNRPSDFYRLRRPEYFSDSEIIHTVELPREQLAFELSQITTNQKQDEFETLCRRLSEKLITPNLIPQVGPTGGGDGKTDAETYPVSSDISDRWFIPENGWEKDEKWAFAFSAKETWKSKAEKDVAKIIDTKRDYTKIFFITNQTPSSKKKKDAQDELKVKYGIEVVILDGIWILEKVFDNKLLDIVVDSLNLSEVYKDKKVVVGSNDAERNKLLHELEEKIQNSNRYSEFDFQLVEDALEVAMLSRKLERPRDEVEGKFDRALRLCKKLNREKQWIRVYYQRAWTYLYYFDDFSAFIADFKEFKKYISNASSISEIELYVNLFNSLRGFCAANCDLESFEVDLSKERDSLYLLLDNFSTKEDKPCSSLIAKFYKKIELLMDSIPEEKSPNKHLEELSSLLLDSEGLIDFPFDTFKKMFEELGVLFPDNFEYDNLIDTIAFLDEKRSSELAAGHTFLRRAIQKFDSKHYKSSIIYFGKSVLKLAKEEAYEGLYIALKGLGYAYNEMGLLWASNNCFISASSIAFKSWYQEGILDSRVYDCAKQLAINEQFIGRIPNFLTWHELFHVIANQIEKEEKGEIPVYELFDACLSVRLLNTNSEQDSLLTLLPDILENQSLWLSQNSVLYKLGHEEIIKSDYRRIGIENKENLKKHFELIAGQPFKEQMVYETNLLSGDKVNIISKILGCSFIFKFEQDLELLFAAESLAAFFESFLATSLNNVIPTKETILFELKRDEKEREFTFVYNPERDLYELSINQFSFNRDTQSKIITKILEFTVHILISNFFINNPLEHLENLFKKEEVNERFSFILHHRNFTLDILGQNPKLFLENWYSTSIKEFPNLRKVPFNVIEQEDKKEYNYASNDSKRPDFDLNKISHDKRNVSSIIDENKWSIAKWKGFGFFFTDKGFYVFIGFENGNKGKLIFEDWHKRFGQQDSEDIIRISIIKGIDKQNPYWYRVCITSDFRKMKQKPGEITVSMTKSHKMTPDSSVNLERLIEGYKNIKKFILCPAEITFNPQSINPYPSHGILKTELIIREAWEIGLNDPDRMGITPDDNPIIPSDIKNAPVLEILKERNA